MKMNSKVLRKILERRLFNFHFCSDFRAFDTKYYLCCVRKTTFKFRDSYLLLLSVTAFLFLHSCKNASSELDFLNEKIETHLDSMNQVFFIPNKENLKSELTFYHELLSDLEQISPARKDSARVDSIQFVLRENIEKTKGWTSGLENYDLQKIIETQFSKDVFLQKEYLSQVPLFYEKGKAVLKKEALAELDTPIQKQIEIYWFLKNEFGENEEVQIAVKDFIGFLNSVKNEK